MGVIHLFLSGGNVMFPLLCISLLNFAFIIQIIFEFRSIKKDLADVNGELLRSKLGVSLSEKLKNISDLEKVWEEEFEYIIFPIEQKIGWIGSLSGIATLLGLLGTVLGIYSAFQKMRILGQANPEIFAGGISEALITTIFGLFIAIPSLLFYHYLKSKLDEIEIDSFKKVFQKLREKK